MIPRGWGAARAVFVVTLAAALLAGCATTVSTTSGPVGEIRGNASGTDQGDPARRARVRLELATAYYGRNQLAVALDEVKLALAADPNLGEAYNLRGLIYAGMGEDALAEDSYRRALQINARDTDSMQNLAWFLCRQKRYPEAQAMFSQALAVPQNRDAARAHLAQGVCHAFAGHLADAELSLLRAFELEPANPGTAVNLAEVLYRRGEYERARFYIRRVIGSPATVSAQTLWLAVRIEHRLGNKTGVQDLGNQLRNRFRESRESVAFERGQFDD